MAADAGQKLSEGGAGELPAEWAGGGVVVLFEGEDLLGEAVQVAEVVGGEQLALDDGEVDLDLVQPGRVDGQVDHLCVRVGLAHAVSGGPVAVRGPVVDDPEDPL